MKILKYPNYKSSKHFHIKGIKGKCTCGCKCQIEDFDDLHYIRGYQSTMNIDFGYYCPYCGSLVELTDRANSKVIKAIMNEGNSISEYIEISNELNFRYEMGYHDTDDSQKIYEMMGKGLPIPIHTRPEIINDGR